MSVAEFVPVSEVKIKEPESLSENRRPERKDRGMLSSPGGITLEHLYSFTQGEHLLMATIIHAIDTACQIPGALAVGLMDMETGKCISGWGVERLNLGVAASGYTESLRALMRALHQSSTRDEIQEISLTVLDQIHLLRPVRKKEGAGLFLLLAVKREGCNEALVRFKFSQIEQALNL
jgi:hypothetical protein